MALVSGDILVYDGAQWNNQPTVSGSVSIDSPTFHLRTDNQRIGIGTTSPGAKLHVRGTADVQQLRVQGFSTQTANIFEVRNNAGDALVTVNNSGVFRFGSGGDTNLYRSAANTLQTDDNLVVAARIGINLATAPAAGYLEIGAGSGSTGIHLSTKNSGSQAPFIRWADEQETPSTSSRAAMRQGGSAFFIGNFPSGMSFSAYMTFALDGGTAGNVGIGQSSPTARLHLGTSGTAGHLRMDGIAGSPASPTAGDHWYDTNKQSHRLQEAIGTLGLTGLLFANTSVPGGNTVENTATETNFASEFAIPADSLTLGKSLKITAAGVYGTAASAPNLILRVKLDRTSPSSHSTVFAATGTLSPGGSLTERGWTLDVELLVVAVGASGEVEAQGLAVLATSTGTAVVAEMRNASEVENVRTDVVNTLRLSAEWSAADAANTIELRLLKVRVDD